MAESSVEICNLAISHLGSSKEITSLTERSNEAAACSRFYETALKATLRDFPWPFATRFAALALVEEDPNDEWAYSYRYPSGCLKFRRILSGSRTDTNSTRVPYKIASDDSGKLVYCDTEDAECEYTVYIDDPTLYPDDFVIAFSLKLSTFIAPRITGADPFKMGERAMGRYFMEIGAARSTAINEQQDDVEPDSELISTRG